VMLLRYLPIKTLLRLWSQVSLKDLSRRVHALSYHFLEPLHVCMYTYICIYIYIYIYISHTFEISLELRRMSHFSVCEVY
jgi:hypothetical protein